MAYNAGDVEARLELDRSPFITGLRTALREAETWRKEATKALHPSADIDQRPFNRALTSMQRRLTQFVAKTYTARVRIDDTGQSTKLTQLQTRLNNLNNRTVRPKIDVAVNSNQLTRLTKQIAAESLRRRNLMVGVDTGRSTSQLTDLNRRLTALGQRIVRPRVEVRVDDGALQRAHATLTAMTNRRYVVHIDVVLRGIRSALTQLQVLTRNRTINVHVNTNRNAGSALTGLTRAFGAVGRAATQARGSKRGFFESMANDANQLKMLTGAILVGFAPALGLISTLLASLPTAMTAFGMGAAAVAIGMDGIKAAAATLTPQVEALQAALNAEWQKGLTPIFERLAVLFPIIQTGLIGTTQAMVGWAESFTSVVTSAQGMESIRQIMANINAAFEQFRTTVAFATQAFLELALVGSQTFGVLIENLNRTAIHFNQMVAWASNTGILHSALTQLANVVGALGYAFVEFMGMGLQMMSVVGGPLTVFIYTLTDAIVALGPILTSISLLFFDIINPLLEIVAVIANALSPALQLLGNLLGTLLGGALTAITPLIKVLAEILGMVLTAALNAIAPLIPVIVNGFKLLAETMAPIGQQIGPILVDVINALAPIFPILADAITQLQQAIIPLIPQLMELAMKLLPIIPPVVGFIVSALGFLIPIIVQVIQWLASFVSSIISFVDWLTNLGDRLGDLNSLWTTVWGSISSFFISIWDSIINFITVTIPQAWNSLIEGAGNAVDSVLNFFRNLPENMGHLLGLVIGTVYVWGQNLYTAISDGVTRALEWFKTLPQRITAFFIGAAVWLYQAGSDILTGLENGIKTAYTAVTTWFSELPANITAFFIGAAVWLFTTGRDLITGFRTGITNAWAAVVTWFINLPTAIGNFFSGAGEWLYNTGRDILLGMLQGLLNVWTTIRGWISEFTAGFIQGFKDALGIASPSTIFAGIGGDILRGLINGLSAMAEGVYNFFSGLWDGMRAIAVTAWQVLEATVRNGVQGFVQFWTTIWNTVSAFFSGLWNTLSSTATNVWNTIRVFLQTGVRAFSDYWSNVWNTISAFFSTIWNTIRRVGETLWNILVAYFRFQLNNFSQFWANIWNTISAFFEGIWNTIRRTGETLWNTISAFFQGGLNAFFDFWSNIWDNILSFFSNTWNTLRDTAELLWNYIVAYYRHELAEFGRYWGGVWDGIVETFENIWSGIVDIAKGIWNQVQSGFVDGVNAVIGIINGFADVINTVAGLVGIELDLHMDPLPAPIPLAAGGQIDYQQVIHRANGGDVTGGGRLPGYSPGRDTLPAMAGKQPYMLGGGEFITNARATRAIGPQGMAAVNNAHRQPVSVVPHNPKTEALYSMGGAIKLATGGQLGALVQQHVPGTRVTSTHRPGVAGYHGSNQAADMAGPTRMDTPFMHRINQWIASNYGATSNELIFTPGINLHDGRPHTYNAATRAGHNDHVHWAHTGPVEGATGSAGEGFFGSIINYLHQQVLGLLDPIRGAMNGMAGEWGFPGQLAAGAINKVLDGLLGMAGPPTMPGGAGVDVSGITGPVQDQVRQVAAQFGWNEGAEWNAILQLVQKESSWNPGAANPTSSARGLFQKMTSLHGPVEPTAAGQAAWGLDYIRGKYGNPSSALRFHLANNWYDDGGILQPGPNLAFNATGKPEAVLTSPQWQSLMETAESARELVNNNTTTNNGLRAEDIERIIAKLVELRPLIGNVQQQLPHGVSPEKMIQELSFELRHVRKGQYE